MFAENGSGEVSKTNFRLQALTTRLCPPKQMALKMFFKRQSKSDVQRVSFSKVIVCSSRRFGSVDFQSSAPSL